MNQNNLQQIFSRYTEKFEYINNPDNDENYKWRVAKEFREYMDIALASGDNEFADALYKAKASTCNIIDSYTQPFHGLVEFARKEPGIVKQMFLDLYSEDGNDLKVQESLIADFFRKSNGLLDKYSPGSYRFKQNSHSVSAYLFLHDPDHHYMYKATQAQIMADCIGFYDDWGTGDNIKLDVFYRMCDELVSEVKKNTALINTDESRFDGRFGVKSEHLIADQEKHMLIFDIIYCCSVYDLFNGISFSRPKTKEKQLYAERKKKAQQLLQEYTNAQIQAERLSEARSIFMKIFKEGSSLKHKLYGNGVVKEIDEKYIIISFQGQEKKLGVTVAIAKGIITSENEDFMSTYEEYAPILNKEESIISAVERTKNALKGYEEYLD